MKATVPGFRVTADARARALAEFARVGRPPTAAEVPETTGELLAGFLGDVNALRSGSLHAAIDAVQRAALADSMDELSRALRDAERATRVLVAKLQGMAASADLASRGS